MTEVLDAILLREDLILATWAWTKENMVMLFAFLVGFGPWAWPLGIQMVELGCQDTHWVDGNDKEVLDAILPGDGFI